MRIDQYLIEGDAFALQGLQDEVLNGPEGILGEGIRAQTVLVAHHHELKIGMLADEMQVAEHTPGEFQLLKGIYLLVGRLFNQCTVAVNKQ